MMRVYFSGMTDKRQKVKTRHDFLELIILTIAAVIGGCNGWDEIEAFGPNRPRSGEVLKPWFFIKKQRVLESNAVF